MKGDTGITIIRARTQIRAISCVTPGITHPPNAKRLKPNKEIGSNIDTTKLNQKSAFKQYLLKTKISSLEIIH
jgi:hypothetical protein